jgi:hypothetical protein
VSRFCVCACGGVCNSVPMGRASVYEQAVCVLLCMPYTGEAGGGGIAPRAFNRGPNTGGHLKIKIYASSFFT